MTRPLIFLGSNSNMLYLKDICDLQQMSVLGIIDSDYHGNRDNLDGLPILGDESHTDFEKLKHDHDFFVASNAIPGNTRDISKRLKFIDLCHQHQLSLGNIIDPTARINNTAQLGQGILVGFCSFIGAHCQIGDHCQIYGHVAFGHHIYLGRNVTVQRQVGVSGKHVQICDDAYIGLGAKIVSTKDTLTIGTGSRIAPGLVVSRDVYAHESVLPSRKRTYSTDFTQVDQ